LLELVFGSCSVEVANKGGSCTRSTECASGLACVKGRCSDDLRSVANQSKVPKLMASSAGDDAGH